MNTKQVEIGDKVYTLTVTRGLSIRMSKVAPKFLEISKKGTMTEEEEREYAIDYGSAIIDNVNVLFYEMLRTAHPDISKEDSNKLYEQFRDEYDDVEDHLLAFFRTSFTDGIPKANKKKLNW